MTGWAIPDFEEEDQESASIYEHLENTILPMYYQQPKSWHEVMRSTIALNGSFFNTQRMLGQYVLNAVFPAQAGEPRGSPPGARTCPLEQKYSCT